MKPETQNLLQLLDLDSLRKLHTGAPLTILVGVSGGADSVALLLSLHSLGVQLPLSISVAHFNHGVRPDASVDAEFVRDLATQLKVPFHLGQAEDTNKPAGTSPEEHWRNQRYHFFHQAMQETSSQYLALGHSADDLAETFLYHLARGTGVAGLQFSFLKTSGSLTIIRPLWQTSRTSIESCLTSLQQPWRVDSTNQDPRFSRNLIRQQVMPALRTINPRATEAILRLSQQLTPSPVPSGSAGPQNLSVPELRKFDEHSLSAAIHQLILDSTGVPPGHRQVLQAATLIQHNDTGLVALGNRSTLVIDQQSIWIYPGQDPTVLDLARVACPPGLLLAALQHPVNPDQPILSLPGRSFIPSIPRHLLPSVQALRNRYPGDRIGSRHLKKILNECRIPWYYRDFLVFAVDSDDRILACINGPDNLILSNHAAS